MYAVRQNSTYAVPFVHSVKARQGLVVGRVMVMEYQSGLASVDRNVVWYAVDCERVWRVNIENMRSSSRHVVLRSLRVTCV